MNNFSILVKRFESLKKAFEESRENSKNSSYSNDNVLAQITIVNSILNNNLVHGYTKSGLQSFLLKLKPGDFNNSTDVIDQIYYNQSFNNYLQLLLDEIFVSRLAGVPIRFAF